MADMSTDFFTQMADRMTGGDGAPNPALAEVKLDLTDHDEARAVDKLGHVLAFCVNTQVKTLFVSFPPVQPGSGQSLFQPVARALKTAKAKGQIAIAVPVMSPDSAGIFVRMAAGE